MELKKAKSDLVQLLLEAAKRHILNLNYEDALNKVQNADTQNPLSESVVEAYLEIAFWYGEIGNITKAHDILKRVAQIMGEDEVPVLLQKSQHKSGEKHRALLHQLMWQLNENAYNLILEKYYPPMVEVQGGTFNMGSKDGGDGDENFHVAGVDDFQIAKTETTIWQFAMYCKASGREIENFAELSWGISGDNPVVYVDWYDAVEYANWLSIRQGFQPVYKIDKSTMDANNLSAFDLKKWIVKIDTTANGYRLPTEAEWEYAAAGGEKKSSYIYAGSDNLDEVGWYSENSLARTNPVARKKPNALGLFDMSGNVWEWCWDWYGNYPDNSSLNYTGPDSGNRRVLRGGSWSYNITDARISGRSFDCFPGYKYYYNGIRLARGSY